MTSSKIKDTEFVRAKRLRGLLSVVSFGILTLAAGILLVAEPLESSGQVKLDIERAGVYHTELVRAAPNQVHFLLDCSLNRDLPQTELLFLEGMTFSFGHDGLVASSTETPGQPTEKFFLAPNCPDRIVIDNTSKTFYSVSGLVSGEATQYVEFRGARASLETFTIPAGNPGNISAVVIESSGALNQQTPLRLVAFVVGILGWVAFGLLISGGPGLRAIGQSLRSLVSWRNPRQLSADLFVLGALMATSFLFPFLYDEGWIFFRSGLSAETGTHLEFFWAESPYTFQGNWIETIFGFLIASGASIHVVRMCVLLVTWFSWLLVARLVTKFFPTYGSAGRFVLATLFLSFSLALQTNIRPEPLVAFFLIIAIFAVPVIWRDGSARAVHLLGGATALALSLHQSGVVLVGPLTIGVLGLAFAAFKGRVGLETIRLSLASAATSGLLLVTLIFQKTDLAMTIREVTMWLNRDGYSGSEFQRWVDVLSAVGWRAWPAVILALALTACLASLKGTDAAQRLLFFTAASALPSLMLAVSTWQWHFASLSGPFVVVVWAAVTWQLQPLDQTERRRRVALLSLLLFLGGVIFSWGEIRRGSDFALRWHIFGATEVKLSDSDMALIALIVVSFVIFVGYQFQRSRCCATGLTAVLAGFSLLLPIGAYTGALLADAFYSPSKWTLAEQRLPFLAERYPCGLLNEGLGSVPISGSDHSEEYITGALFSGASRNAPGEILIQIPPATTEDTFSVWARWGEGSAPAFVAATGVEVLNWPGNEDAVTWERKVYETHWTEVRVAGAQNAQTLSLYTFTNDKSSSLMVTKPVPTRLESWDSMTRELPVLANPGLIPYLPCSDFIGVEGERLERPAFAISTNFPPRASSFRGHFVEIDTITSRGQVPVSLFQLVDTDRSLNNYPGHGFPF